MWADGGKWGNAVSCSRPHLVSSSKIGKPSSKWKPRHSGSGAGQINLVPWSTKQHVMYQQRYPTCRHGRISGRGTSLPDSFKFPTVWEGQSLQGTDKGASQHLNHVHVCHLLCVLPLENCTQMCTQELAYIADICSGEDCLHLLPHEHQLEGVARTGRMAGQGTKYVKSPSVCCQNGS